MRDEERDEQTEQKKRPVDMTTDELLDYALAPELTAELRRIVQGDKPDDENSEETEC